MEHMKTNDRPFGNVRNKGSLGENNLGDACSFSKILLYFLFFFGFISFQKWLIKVPGHIPILLG